jgi:hypothetical protein
LAISVIGVIVFGSNAALLIVIGVIAVALAAASSNV